MPVCEPFFLCLCAPLLQVYAGPDDQMRFECPATLGDKGEAVYCDVYVSCFSPKPCVS